MYQCLHEVEKEAIEQAEANNEEKLRRLNGGENKQLKIDQLILKRKHYVSKKYATESERT